MSVEEVVVRDNIPLGRIAGFPLAVNWSVLVILWLFTWSLATYSLPTAAPGHTTGTYWLAGLAGAVVLLGSLLAHELAHALVARHYGLPVKGLTLWMFGGVAALGGEAPTPGAEFRIAAVGPATSLALAGVFAGGAVGLTGLGAPALVLAVAWWLATVNLLLGVFNLIPGAPLDGGRILRAILWQRRGDRVRAAVGAARAGQIIAFALIGLGLVEVVSSGFVGGLWLVFIGWFVYSAARAEESDVVTRQLLSGVRVADVMSPDPRVGPSWSTVDDFVQRYVLGERHSAYPVAGFDGTVEGLVTLAQLRAVRPEARGTTRVRDVAIPLAHVPTASPGDSLIQLLERTSRETGGRALVFDAGRLVGIVTPADIARTADLRSLQARPPTAPLPG